MPNMCKVICATTKQMLHNVDCLSPDFSIENMIENYCTVTLFCSFVFVFVSLKPIVWKPCSLDLLLGLLENSKGKQRVNKNIRMF